MSSASWTLAGTTATLNLPGHTAEVDLLRPDLGLQLSRVAGQMIDNARLLGVLLPAWEPSEPPVIADAYVRGDDLIVVYAQTPARPARVEAYWRLVRRLMPKPAPLCVDLQLSVQTHLLGSDPTLVTSSRLGAESAARLREGATGEFVEVHAPLRLAAAEGPGCLLTRLDRPADLSYLELVHPSDFVECGLESGERPKELHLAQRLFPETLEKGVIRRARVRGLFLSRHEDEQASVPLFGQFAAEAPPLTT